MKKEIRRIRRLQFDDMPLISDGDSNNLKEKKEEFVK
jgi:hypothetical protein